jgi:glycosyltransferase involved in cell wall biosynthesis
LILERFQVLELPLLLPGLFLATLVFLFRNSKKIDLIHSQGFVAGAVANVMSLLFRKPFVVSIHWVLGQGRLSSSRFMGSRLLSRVRVILTMSKVAETEMVGIGFSADRVMRFNYWVDLDQFRPKDRILCKRSIGLKERDTLVLFVGRLVPGKGVLDVLDIAKEFESDPCVKFGIAGSGHLESKIKADCQGRQNLLFFGAIPNERLPIYYNSADIVLVPSLHDEGFPRVIVEAISCGTPVVASNKGSIPEAVNNKIGVVCEPNLANFVDRISLLLGNRELLKSLSGRCREFALKHYGEGNALEIEEAYDIALQKVTTGSHSSSQI